MRNAGPALRLSIFLRESDHRHHKPLYAEIVHRAHQAGLAGATVIRGIEGFGASSQIHTNHRFRLGQDLPVLIIVTDLEERIRDFLPRLDDLDIQGLVALDQVETVHYAQPDRKHPHWWSTT